MPRRSFLAALLAPLAIPFVPKRKQPKSLKAILLSAKSGDHIYLGPGTYKLDYNPGDYNFDPCVSLHGAGMNQTTLVSANS